MQLSRIVESLESSPTLAVTRKVAELKAKGEKVIAFGAGEPDFNTPEYIRTAATEAMNSGKTKYTVSSGIPELKEAICKKLADDNGVTYKAKNILVSNGAKHALWNAVFSLVNDGDEVMVFAPYWVSYTEQIKTARGVPVIINCPADNNFEPRMEDIENNYTSRTKLLILNTPNNPTGAVYSEKFMKELANFVIKKNIWVISDEIYEKLIYDGAKHFSIATFIPEHTIIINGVSKAYAMTGWRIGYAAGPDHVIKAMGTLQEQITSCPNSISQYASFAALSQVTGDLEMMCGEFKKRRDYMVERLNKIPGIKCNVPPGAFYVFPDVRDLMAAKGFVTSDALIEYILDNVKVAGVSGSAFGMEGFIRFSYATSLEAIREGMDRIEELFK